MALRVTTATPFMSGQLQHCRRRQCSNGGAHYSGISLETRVALLFEPHPFGMVCMAELYEVLDPRPNAAAAPYTFFLPDPELIEAICKGDHVKAIIRAVPPSEKSDAARMWIRITSARSDWLEGTLDSQPRDMPKLLLGAILHLPRSHVIDVVLADPARMPPTVKPRREYWARCMV